MKYLIYTALTLACIGTIARADECSNNMDCWSPKKSGICAKSSNDLYGKCFYGNEDPDSLENAVIKNKLGAADVDSLIDCIADKTKCGE